MSFCKTYSFCYYTLFNKFKVYLKLQNLLAQSNLFDGPILPSLPKICYFKK